MPVIRDSIPFRSFSSFIFFIFQFLSLVHFSLSFFDSEENGGPAE